MDEQTGSEARRPSALVTKPVRGELGFEHGNNYLRRWKPSFQRSVPSTLWVPQCCGGNGVLSWGPRKDSRAPLWEAAAWGRGSLKLEPTQTTGPGQLRVPSPSAGKSSLVCTRPGTKASVRKCCAMLKLVPLCPHPRLGLFPASLGWCYCQAPRGAHQVCSGPSGPLGRGCCGEKPANKPGQARVTT